MQAHSDQKTKLLASCTYEFVAQLPQMYIWLHMPGSQVNHVYSFVIRMDRAIQCSCFSSRDFGLNCLLVQGCPPRPRLQFNVSFMSILCQLYINFMSILCQFLCQFHANFMPILCQKTNLQPFFWNMSLTPPLDVGTKRQYWLGRTSLNASMNTAMNCYSLAVLYNHTA